MSLDTSIKITDPCVVTLPYTYSTGTINNSKYTIDKAENGYILTVSYKKYVFEKIETMFAFIKSNEKTKS